MKKSFYMIAFAVAAAFIGGLLLGLPFKDTVLFIVGLFGA